MKRKILIVDDSKFNIKMLEDILIQEQYSVTSLTDGTSVEEVVASDPPDAILLDIIMPQVDGFTICSRLKSNEDTWNIPIIMITSMTEGSNLRRAFELGAFDYIKKPFEPIEVVARLQSALRFYDQQKSLEELAMKDGLTGLFNHRLSMEFLEKECCKARRSDSSISFLMLDIDYFKNINDTYGHKSGDQILKDLSMVLLSSVRVCDIVGRYGGEEFCIILSGQSSQGVIDLAERIRQIIQQHRFTLPDGTIIKITVSIGISHSEAGTRGQCNDIVIQADQALYQAKRSGRNQIRSSIMEK